MNIPEVTATLVSRMQHAQTEPDAIVNVIPADSSIYATAGTNFILASDAPDPNGSNNGNSVFNAPVDEVIERLRDEATARAVRFVEHVSGMEEFRQLCFDITSEEDLKFPKALFDMYWVKDVEHIFAKDSGRRPLKKSGGFTQYYSCRRANKSHGYKPVPIEERKRSKSQRVPDQCDVRVSSPICIKTCWNCFKLFVFNSLKDCVRGPVFEHFRRVWIRIILRTRALGSYGTDEQSPIG